MSVIIRRARLSDFKTVSRLNGQSVDTTYSFYNPQIQELMRKRNSGWRLLKARLDGLREVLVAVDDGLTVGYLIGSANSDGVAFVYSLYVDASQRGKKTGERLLEYFESKVVAESVHRIMLWTEVAAPYYRKIGWHEAADMPNHWWGQRFWIFVKDIDRSSGRSSQAPD